MAMDAKDLRTEGVLGDRSNDGNAKYTQGGATLPCNRTKPYQDIGSSSLGKVDVQAARPCAVIGPDRVVPPPASSDVYLKKGPTEPWLTTENTYRRPPDYPHKGLDYQNPARNISPRQTFQENMQRIMVPPSYSSVKLKEDHTYPVDSNNISPMRNNKFNVPSDPKYCEVPYVVNNTMTNEQKSIRNSDISVAGMNPIARSGMPQGWHPNSANIRPQKPYGTPELYQYPDYPSCAGPRPILMPRTHRTVHEEANHMYPDTYYQEGSIRFKPYPSVKDRFAQPRYDYITNYSNPFHPPPPFPTHKYELQKPVHSHPYPGYPQVPMKYLDGRMPEPVMNGYQRPNPQAHFGNVPFRNQVMHPSYGPVAGNCLQTNKYYPFPPDSSAKPSTSNKLSYDPNNKIFQENFYVNDLARTPHTMKGQVLPPNYPGNMYGMPPNHPYYRRENTALKGYEFGPHVRNIDTSINMNGPTLSRFPSQFSPTAIPISPSDSSTSNDINQTQGIHDDCYINQSAVVNMRGMDSGINRMPHDIYRRYDHRYSSVVKSSMMSKYDGNSLSSSKDKKDIDVRQFLSMWNEGEEENGDNNCHENSVNPLTNAKDLNGYESNNQEQLYVLGLVNVPSEELAKYEHIQKVSKLPENIKGYNSIELLHQFEEVIESSNLNSYKPITPRTFDTSLKGPPPTSLHSLNIPPRPISPLDVEAKISQSVIHKEVGCNFEIKPCSPKMLNVEIAAPVQSVLNERAIEKVTNPLIVHSPILNNANENNVLKCQEQGINENVSSCKMANTQFTNSDRNSSVKTNYSLQDLESSSGVCLASLPRLDNDIELNFPEVNQQFINANKVETTSNNSGNTSKDLPDLEVGQAGEKDPVLQEIDQCLTKSDLEKNPSKLSKYRKFKRKSQDTKEVPLETNVQALRTDSVIIKNPDNVKNQEECLMKSPKTNIDEAQQDPINLTVATVKNTSDENEPILNKCNDLAIDFSLNSSEHNIAETESGALKTTDEKSDHSVEEDSKLNASFSEVLDDPNYSKSEYESSKTSEDDQYNSIDDRKSDKDNTESNISSISENKTAINLPTMVTGKDFPAKEELILNSLIEHKEKTSPKNDVNVLTTSKSGLFIENDSKNNDFSLDSEFAKEVRNDSVKIKDVETDAIKDRNSNIKDSQEENILDDSLINTYDSKNTSEKSKRKSKKRREKKKAHKIKSFKINSVDFESADKPDEIIKAGQTGETETNNINLDHLDLPKDFDGTHMLDDQVDTEMLVNKNTQESNSSIEQLNFKAGSKKNRRNVIDLSPSLPDEKQETQIADILSPLKETILDSIIPVDRQKNVEKEVIANIVEEPKSTKSPCSTENINHKYKDCEESQVFANSLVPKSETNNKQQFEENHDNFIEKSERKCIYEEPQEQLTSMGPKEYDESRSDINQRYLEATKLTCGIIESKDLHFERTIPRHKVTSSGTIKKELFSPQIQRLILKEEGLCSAFRNISAFRNMPDGKVQNNKGSTVLIRHDEILSSFSSDTEMSITSVEMSNSPKNFEYQTTENSPLNILESLNNRTNFASGSCDGINLLADIEPNNQESRMNLMKSDYDTCERVDVLNTLTSSANLDESVDKHKKNVLLLTDTKLIQNISASCSPDMEAEIKQFNTFGTGTDKFSSLEQTSSDEECIEESKNNDDFASEDPSMNPIHINGSPCDDTKPTNIEDDHLWNSKYCSENDSVIEQVASFSKTNSFDSNECLDNFETSELSNKELSITMSEESTLSEVKLVGVISPHSPSNESNSNPKTLHSAEIKKQVENDQDIDDSFENEISKSNHQPDYVNVLEDEGTFHNDLDNVQYECEPSPVSDNHLLNENAKNVISVHENVSMHPSEDIQNKNVQYLNNYKYKKKKYLKRSMSESALDDICDNNAFEGCGNKPLLWPNKRQKVDEIENTTDVHFVNENLCNLIQHNRRNSVSSIYNEDNVSFCILIDNNCIIAEDDEEEGTEKICFAEIPEDCIPCIEDNSDEMVCESENTSEEKTDEIAFQGDVISSPTDDHQDEEKELEGTWVDDIACIETVGSEDVAEDIVISASTSPKNYTDEELNDDVDIYGDHTDKVKYIYGDKMCSDDAHLVETLYRTPQMDVNKTLINRDYQIVEENFRYYDKESLEKVLSDSVIEDEVFESTDETRDMTFLHAGYSSSTNSEIVHDSNKIHSVEHSLISECSKDKFDNNGQVEFMEKKDIEEISQIPTEQTQDRSVHSCESSVDDVFSYLKDESPKRETSSSPEVSSTTSEEKNSSILLKITNYNGSRVSEINNINTEHRISCKYTEDKDYISSHNSLPTRPLITKAAQKYIPPLKESIRDLKIQLALPQQSLLKLKLLKVAKEKSNTLPNTNNTVRRKDIPKKPKPKFEDVLKSIDEIQVKKHKESKKIKKAVPKVVIKKNQNGSHYASTSNSKDKYNPDLTGRKWQPWVFIERNNFVDKMALKNKTRAVFSYRKNEFVLAEKFRKYRSVSSAKFIISQPKLQDSVSGQLKYTIKLKHTY